MLVIIQARFSSTRLPGKVLRPLGGRPMLAWLIERLRMARGVSDIMVATSKEREDDALASFCGHAGVSCARGPLADVAERLAEAAESAAADVFVRISGDSPLMVPTIVDDVIALYRSRDLDLATNVQRRTFPKGLSVEAIRVSALRRAQPMMQPGEAEHVTKVFYRRPEEFRISNLTSGHDWGDVQLSVDTIEDFALLERMISAIGGSEELLGLEQLVALRERCLSGEASQPGLQQCRRS